MDLSILKEKRIIYRILMGVFGFVIFVAVFSINDEYKQHMNQAESAILNGNYDIAKSILDKELEDNPQKEEAYLLFSDYHIALKDYLAAVNILEKGQQKISNSEKIKNKLLDIKNTYSSEIAEQNKKQEEERIALNKKLEEARIAREQEEAKRKEKEKEDFIASAQTVEWEELTRNPGNYINKPIKVVGKVAQIVNESSSKSEVRVYEDYDIMKSNTFMKKEWYISIDSSKSTSRLIKEDVVIFYGTYTGTKAVTRSLTKVTENIPSLNVKYYEVSK